LTLVLFLELVEFSTQLKTFPVEKFYADTRIKVAACHSVSAMFGIGRGDDRNIGLLHTFEAMGNRHRIIYQIIIVRLDSARSA
jgi:peroxiredoxin family protein